MPAPAKRSCPRTGRSRGDALAAGRIRPSDMLVVFLLAGASMILLGGLAALIGELGGWWYGRWLALHLVFVGGISQLVLGAAQFFAGAFLATDPPHRRILRAQLVCWNLAVVAISIGVPTGITALSGAGGVLVLAVLALFALALRQMQRRSLQRQPWAVRWYFAGAAFLAVGASLGPVLADGVAWAHGSLLAAHLTLNLGGWFGAAIVGTLHTFYPSLTGTRLRFPALQRPTFQLWVGGIALLAIACAFDVRALAALAWIGLAVASALLCLNVFASSRAAIQRSLSERLVLVAQPMLLLGALTGLAITISSGTSAALVGPDRDVVAVLLAGGWIALTVAGSLLHLLGLMSRVRNFARPARPEAAGVWQRGLPPAAAALVVLWALARLLEEGALAQAAEALLGVALVALAAMIIIAAVRAMRAAPLRF